MAGMKSPMNKKMTAGPTNTHGRTRRSHLLGSLPTARLSSVKMAMAVTAKNVKNAEASESSTP